MGQPLIQAHFAGSRVCFKCGNWDFSVFFYFALGCALPFPHHLWKFGPVLPRYYLIPTFRFAFEKPWKAAKPQQALIFCNLFWTWRGNLTEFLKLPSVRKIGGIWNVCIILHIWWYVKSRDMKKKPKLSLHFSCSRDRCCEKHEESNFCPENGSGLQLWEGNLKRTENMKSDQMPN